MGVQALRPELAVHAFDERVVGRLAGAAEVERDTVHEGSQIEVSANKFGPVVEPDRLRVTDLGDHPL